MEHAAGPNFPHSKNDSGTRLCLKPTVLSTNQLPTREPLTALARGRCPGSDTERSQHDFHCQRAKDESHYTDEDGRALPTDHTQNRVRKKQQEISQEKYHQKDYAGLDPLRHRIDIVIGQDDYS